MDGLRLAPAPPASLRRLPPSLTPAAPAPPRTLRWLLPRRSPAAVVSAADPRRGGDDEGSWVMKILSIRSIWSAEKARAGDSRSAGGDPALEAVDNADRCVRCLGEESDACDLSSGGSAAAANGGTVEFDRETFSSYLRRASHAETKLYAKMSFLGTLAYNIPRIKPASLFKFYGLRFMTSSLEKKSKSVDAVEKEMTEMNDDNNGEWSSLKVKIKGFRITPSAAYSVAASAASFIQFQMRGILQLASREEDPKKEGDEECEIANCEMASFMAAADTVTAVVAAEEEVKQAVADDLSSARSPPCEWFICDDAHGTRYFAIQGSQSLTSWKANLLFEPVQFEGFDVLVHRGIYEAAKGIYKQILPEVQDHLKSWGTAATFRFTGHSLGGSLSVLVSLMLFIRGVVPSPHLLPIVTFGAPCVLCNGDSLLHKLGLPQNYVQAIMMHRDIVPRAFSCNYPDHIAQILKALNRKFHDHPCLKKQKYLYAPVGKLLILQPDARYSPFHPLLPSESGLYILGHSSRHKGNLLQAAESTFLNSPHPLEVLRERAAYSSRGTVTRNHRVHAYLRCLYGVVREELEALKKTNYDSLGWRLWPLSENSLNVSVAVGWRRSNQFGFSAALQGGKKRLSRLKMLVASGRASMLIMLLVPARSMFIGMLHLVPWS